MNQGLSAAASLSGQSLRSRAEELVATVRWLHSIELFPDLLVPGIKPRKTMERERSTILEAIDFKGRSVIDIGSWNGFFAFEAKRLGAKRVIATDSFVWTHPDWRGRETFDLARECLALDIEAVEIDPTALPGLLEPAEIVLFLGVFYHLFDPIDVLNRVAALASEVLIVETHQDMQFLSRPAMAFYPHDELNADTTNWWAPNPACMYQLLRAKGFETVLYQSHPITAYRGIYHAFRSRSLADAYLLRQVDNETLFDLGSELGQSRIFGRSPLGVMPSIRQAAEIVASAVKRRLGIGR